MKRGSYYVYTTGLCKCANFKLIDLPNNDEKIENVKYINESQYEETKGEYLLRTKLDSSLKGGEFHFNIQVHLPSNGTEETYINIFSAIRKVF